MKARCAIVLAIAMLMVVPSSSLHLFLKEGEYKCYIEELRQGVDALIHYDVVPVDHNGKHLDHKVGVILTVFDNEEESNIVHQEEPKSDSRDGVFVVSPKAPGTYHICLSTNSKHWLRTHDEVRVDLKIDVGADAVDFSDVAKKEHLEGLQVLVKKLVMEVQYIMDEFDYQMEREVEFRNTSESTNSRVKWWSVFQLVILFISFIWQIQHLKGFFKEKKLV